jgi:hypothetical protein
VSVIFNFDDNSMVDSFKIISNRLDAKNPHYQDSWQEEIYFIDN